VLYAPRGENASTKKYLGFISCEKCWNKKLKFRSIGRKQADEIKTKGNNLKKFSPLQQFLYNEDSI
jgi:hypothetical protein